ncbi:MAG: efflux RND transporter periplasmic adaptor subunit [Deltaproteobacteria bacterium]|nr:efflux RND transporter periplasmic adaptor subunit [Deltaproteobacteria bacterium]
MLRPYGGQVLGSCVPISCSYARSARQIWSLLGVFLVLVVIFVAPGCAKEKPTTAAAPPPPEVIVAEVVQREVPIYSEWLGTTDGSVNAQIRARVQGYLQSRDYREGTFVKSGDLLFTIDARTYQAALDQAKGDLARAEANMGKTQLDVNRDTPLAKEGAISQQELDNAVQSNQANKASVGAARAAVKQAELNLEWTQIRSPIDGIAGIAIAQIGDLIEPNTLLTTVSRVNPIKVTFPLSEREYLKFADRIATAMEAEQRSQPHGPPLELVLADGKVYPEPGGFALPDREVDLKTGTIIVVSYFPNPQSILRPGLYAKVRAVTETRPGALLVPQRSVQELQGSYRVAVVGADNKVELRPVKAGARIGSLWIIEEGLKPGDHVIIEGLQKIRDGVTVNPKLAPVEPEPQKVPVPAPATNTAAAPPTSTAAAPPASTTAKTKE